MDDLIANFGPPPEGGQRDISDPYATLYLLEHNITHRRIEPSSFELFPEQVTTQADVAGLDTLPTEILIKIANQLNLRDLTSLLKCCKHTQRALRGQYYIERQVKDERDFDYKRFILGVHPMMGYHIINFTLTEVAQWPKSRAAKYASQDARSQRIFDDLDENVARWGAGILYFTFSSVDFVWDKALVRQLPRSHRDGSLVNRAISSCYDMKVFIEIIRTYSRVYLVSLMGHKPKAIRRRYTGGYSLANDLPPVLWACCENRADILDILTLKREEIDMEIWRPMDVNMVIDDHNTSSDILMRFDQWHHRTSHLLDAWECAFHPIYSEGRRKHSAVNEDVCIWLLDRNLGFSTRRGGLPIQHLAEAAVLKKTRVVEALLKHFKASLTVKKYQRAIVLALHAAARGWAGPHEPKPHRRHQQRLIAAQMIPDGHEVVIEILLQAGDAKALLKQNPGRKVDEGLLARAVRTAPQNALYLLKKQMQLKATDQRDVRAALFAALTLGGNGDTKRFEFFRTVFPHHFDLACDAEQLGWGGYRCRWEIIDLMNDLIAKMRDCFETRCFTTALYVVGWLGRDRVGLWMVEAMEEMEARQVARRQRRAAAALAVGDMPTTTIKSTVPYQGTREIASTSATSTTTL
ncbi:hypothetical protein PG985_000138 [Apiospora marii]|uniref:uncharacterized protein n=1 Tax=Apiospora marii TaxID=335849 RepID=UPI00312F32F1